MRRACRVCLLLIIGQIHGDPTTFWKEFFFRFFFRAMNTCQNVLSKMSSDEMFFIFSSFHIIYICKDEKIKNISSEDIFERTFQTVTFKDNFQAVFCAEKYGKILEKNFDEKKKVLYIEDFGFWVIFSEYNNYRICKLNNYQLI